MGLSQRVMWSCDCDREDVTAESSMGDISSIEAENLRAERKRTTAAAVKLETPNETLLNVGIVSWNCGNSAPPNDLSGFIPAGGEGLDVLVLGVQECWYTANKDSAAEKTIPFCDGTTKPVHDMFGAFSNHLGAEWVVVKALETWEMKIIVFVRRNVAPDISEIETSVERTGLAHVCGNKRGLLVRFCINGTSVAFVSCHFAAH